MACLSPLPEFVEAVAQATERGVNSRFLIPETANFQEDLNKKTVRALADKCSGKVEAFASPCMVQTKLIMTEKAILFGSYNTAKNAFDQPDELDFTAKRDPENSFTKEIETALSNVFSESRQAEKKTFALIRCRPRPKACLCKCRKGGRR